MTVVERLNAALEGRYRIEGGLGEGGMATVYLAEDVRHHRKVALKVLRPELAAMVGGERFLAEIQVTANLQHPHILPLFDSGDADGFLFYVMPLVEGESLRERLDREHQLPVDEALRITTDVASGLDYAHRQGVVHRDIKPANILLHDGEPLLADFGIALAVQEAGAGRLTETGLSLGTPFYMSPEQAMADQDPGPRSDVYSLACVLYEMLTGDPPFTGSTAQAVLGKIITADPVRPSELRKSVPLHVDAAVLHALEKLPADRFGSVAGFAEALGDPRYGQEVRAAGPAAVAASARSAGPWRTAALALGVVAVGLAVALAVAVGRPGPAPTVFRTAVALPDDQRILNPRFGPSMALSPDGTRLVYAGPSDEGPSQFWMRRADALDATPLAGTHSATFPVFSPDGDRVAVRGATGELRVLDLVRGTSRDLTRDAVQIIDWTEDGVIYYHRGVTFGDTWRIPEDGGAPEPAPVISGDPGPSPPWGTGDVLPGGRSIVVTSYPPGNAGAGTGSVVAVNFEDETVTTLVQGSNPRYVDGRLVWLTPEGDLMAATFDVRRLEITGTAVLVVPGVLQDINGVAHYALSDEGSLVYRRGERTGGGARLVWVDRDGSRTPASGLDVRLTSGLWDIVALSPDGSRVALALADGATSDIWVQNLEDDRPPTRVTFGSDFNVRPRWTPDGHSLSFVTRRGGEGRPTQLWMTAADGTGTPSPLVQADVEVEEGAVSPDGTWVVYRVGGTTANRDIYALRPGVDSVGRPLAATDANERAASLSPDGRWLAYTSDETGRDEVFVTPFPDVSGGRWQVSSGGGLAPVWAHNGRELFFVGASSDLMVMEYSTTDDSFIASRVRPLFRTSGLLTGNNPSAYAVAPDDQRFLMLSLGGDGTRLVWVRNWLEELDAEGAERTR